MIGNINIMKYLLDFDFIFHVYVQKFSHLVTIRFVKWKSG